MRFSHSLLIIFLALTFTAQAQSRRDIADPVCGAIYPRGEGPACGEPTSYREARSPACGVDTYKLKQSASCPGYVPADSYFVRVNSYPYCQDGYRPINVVELPLWDEAKPTARHMVSYTCVRDEVIQSCRKPPFGVERWKSCRSPAHGPERYPVCESPAFGLPVGYKVCSLIASTDEVADFLREMGSQLPQTTRLYIANTASLATLSKSADALSCLLRKWESDMAALDIVMDLKQKYSEITGRPYDSASPIDCSNLIAAIESSPACNDDTPLCVAQSSRLAARSWLEQKRDYALAIKDDLVAMQSSQTRAAIENSLAQLADALAK